MANSLLLLLALILPGEAAVEWDEVLATANENLTKCSTLRVTWQLVSQDTAALREHELSLVEVMRADVAKQRSRSEESARSISESADKLEVRARQSSRERPETRVMDFWSNRRNFQIREIPKEYAASAPGFPDNLGLANELESHFSKVAILSYGPATNHTYRTWNAEQVKGVSSGGVSTAYPASSILFPPLGAWEATWTGTRLAIDQWLRDPSDSATVLGTAVIDGRSCVVVRRIWGKGKIREEKSYTVTGIGWLDLERGALPLRLEFYRSVRGEGSQLPERVVPTDYSKPFPFVVCRDISLRDVAGVWYPGSGVQEAVGPTRMVTDVSADVKGVPHRLLTWTATRIEVNREMPEEIFALRFPERTVFVSQPTGDIRVAGDADEFGRKLVLGALESTDRSNFKWARWTYGGLCLAFCLALAFWRWRRFSQ